MDNSVCASTMTLKESKCKGERRFNWPWIYARAQQYIPFKEKTSFESNSLYGQNNFPSLFLKLSYSMCRSVSFSAGNRKISLPGQTDFNIMFNPSGSYQPVSKNGYINIISPVLKPARQKWTKVLVLWFITVLKSLIVVMDRAFCWKAKEIRWKDIPQRNYVLYAWVNFMPACAFRL